MTWVETGTATSTVIATIPNVEDRLEPADYRLLRDLLQGLGAKRHRNQERLNYYLMKNLFKDLGISIPPTLRHLDVAMGWPAKAVDLLARRIRFESFTLPGDDVANWGIPEAWTENRMEIEAPQAIVSSLINPPAFIAVTRGDVAAGEPQALINVASSMAATGVWHPVRRRLSAYLHVHSADRVVMITPERAIGMTRDSDTGQWDVRKMPNTLGRVPVEPLVYHANPFARPLGTSRITRAVRSITDSAMRTVVRSEVGAEFYSSPQRYLMGADEEMFTDLDGQRKSVWDLVMGRILAMPLAVDEETGEVLPPPEVGQFPQISMQPHTEHLRMWATLFAGETGIDVSDLGVLQDNPASAEARYAAKENLIVDAEDAQSGFGPGLVRTMQTLIQVRDNLRELPPELAKLGARWRDPSTPSRAAATDAVMKQVQAGVLPAESDVALESLGYDETTIDRIRQHRAGVGAGADMETLTAMIQKVYLAVGTVITAEEARALLNSAGAGLSEALPPLEGRPAMRTAPPLEA